MGWQIFDADADGYEAWYASPRGRRAERSERKLIDWLLGQVPQTETVLEIGCGTGHFTAPLAERGRYAIGLDRAPAMVATLRRLHPALPVVLGDAHKLPFRDGAVDVTGFVTTLEFLEELEVALAEAVRVSRQGLILVALNSWSAGAVSRRWGRQARGPKRGKQAIILCRSLPSSFVRRPGIVCRSWRVGVRFFLPCRPGFSPLFLSATSSDWPLC